MKKYLTKKNVIIASICFILVVLIVLFFTLNPLINFKTKSDKEIYVSVNTKYENPIVKAYFINKNITKYIKMVGKVNISKIGTYNLKYTVKYLIFRKSITFKVNVIDKEPPLIKLVGDSSAKICPNTKYIEEGYSAFDNYDLDITKKVVRRQYDNYIEYKIKDSSNNKFSIKRNIIYKDDDAPVITLNGSINNKIVLNTNFNDLGYSALDNCDLDITGNVEVINNIDTSKIGKYSIIYKVRDKSGNEALVTRNVEVVNRIYSNDYVDIVDGPTYINGILIVNKKYSIPATYISEIKNEAENALSLLQSAATSIGYSIPLVSGYRSYYTQQTLYNNYVARDGVAVADTYSARPGHSEHQTGLAFDVGNISDNYGETSAGIWLRENVHNYGFIIRYPNGKEYITGYQYEPWHIRYVGVDNATKIYNSGITLEEYLGV